MRMTVALFAALMAASGGARADIVIGLAVPMTGENAPVGEQIFRGAEMAVADINARGGLLGQPLKLEVGDDGCDPKRAVAVAQQLVAKKVPFVYGHWCSGSTIPASLVYNEAKVLQFTNSSNPLVTERGLKNLFRIFGRDDQQGRLAATFMSRRFKDKKIAVIDDKSTYGLGIAEEIAKGLASAGVAISLRESINPGEKDYMPLIKRLKSADVAAIAYGGYHSEVAQILNQAQQVGYRPMVMGGDSLATSEFAKLIGPLANNVIFTFSPDHRKNPAAANVVRRFREAKIEPEGYVLYGYATLQVFAQAVTASQTLDYDKLRNTVAEGVYDTVVGKIVFDAKGDDKNPGFVVYQWTGSRYDNVK